MRMIARMKFKDLRDLPVFKANSKEIYKIAFDMASGNIPAKSAREAKAIRKIIEVKPIREATDLKLIREKERAPDEKVEEEHY